MKPRNRIQFECPEVLDQNLRAYCERTQLGQSEVIRAALTEYLDRRSTAPQPGGNEEKRK